MSYIRHKPKRGRVRRPNPEMALYVREISSNNSEELTRLKRNVIRAINEELTDRQQQVLTMYYLQEMTINQVAEELGVYPSTAYRTLHRAEDRLKKLLKYGADRVLLSLYDD